MDSQEGQVLNCTEGSGYSDEAHSNGTSIRLGEFCWMPLK